MIPVCKSLTLPSLPTKLVKWVLLVSLLSACQPSTPATLPPPVQTPSFEPATLPPASPSPAATQENLPTPVLAFVEFAQNSFDPAASIDIPTAAPDPLRFVFPTPKPPPVSAWRPPLYPTPWVPTEFDHFLFSRPIAADEVNWPLADYRYGGVFLPEVVHTGIDIPAPIGTPVLAAGSGRITWAGYGLYRGEFDTTDPYGLAVVIRHDFGFQGEILYSVYGHLNLINVSVGQKVETGDFLGEVGQTGKVTGPHLHFEIRVGRNNFFGSRNPELWLAPPMGWGVLAARITDTSGFPLIDTLVTIYSKDAPQSWTVKTYGAGPVVSDAYYRENLVLGDLPAGSYFVWIDFAGVTYNLDFTISPGLVTYFTFKGKNGFKTSLPPTPGADFTPNAPTPGP